MCRLIETVDAYIVQQNRQFTTYLGKSNTRLFKLSVAHDVIFMEIRTIELNSRTCHKQQTFDVHIHILIEPEGDFVGRIAFNYPYPG